MSVRSSNGERDEWHAPQLLPNLVDHAPVLYQKLAPLHHLLAIKTDVEIAANAVDMCFGKPLGAGVLGVWMTKGDVHSRDLFVLQNVADNMRAGGVGANREFADTIAVLVSARVSAKFVAQTFVLRAKIDNAVVFDLDGERILF